jgi:hypothetical protein
MANEEGGNPREEFVVVKNERMIMTETTGETEIRTAASTYSTIAAPLLQVATLNNRSAGFSGDVQGSCSVFTRAAKCKTRFHNQGQSS